MDDGQAKDDDTMDTTLETTIRERLRTEKQRTGPPPDAVAVPPIPATRGRP